VRTELTIDDLAPGGEGVGRAGARPVFVPYAAPGDRVAAEVPPGEGPAHAALLEVLAPGAARLVPPCPHFPPPEPGAPADVQAARACGGCEWQHVRYEAQLAAKERTVVEALRRIGRLEPGAYPLAPILRSPAPLRYRARAKLHLDRGGRRLVFFRRRSHAPVAIEACLLLEPGLEALRAALGPALVDARLLPREVSLEWSALEGRGSALLAIEPTAAAAARAEALVRAVPALAGLVLRGEEGPPAIVGTPVLKLARDPARPEAGAQRTRPDVFQQANRGANAALVTAALDLLRPEGEDVLELYCGAGNFTGPLAACARAVAAVEVQGPALDLARDDLAAAGNVRFFAGDALKLAAALAAERGPGARRFGAALLDPPREGAKGLGRALRDLGVGRAVYVSCDPATLARDVRGCLEAGFRVRAVQPVDMFPQTHHVEAVVALERG
jgi:23S rRNA (uracil1939-C5)-methyltransferase